MRAILMLAGSTILLSACHDHPRTGAPVVGGRTASATLRLASGQEVGRARVTEVAGGLRVTVDARGMPAGTHGAHIHAVGSCDAPDFASAGGHWNPTNAHHGSMNPAGPHQGDLPNLVVDSGGRGTIAGVVPGASMDALLDADGAAVVIHANADDLMTDPSGNSGARIACGVLSAS